jgi:hypothetical protein
MIPSSGCPPWPPDHPRTRSRTGNPTPPRGARPLSARSSASWRNKPPRRPGHRITPSLELASAGRHRPGQLGLAQTRPNRSRASPLHAAARGRPTRPLAVLELVERISPDRQHPAEAPRVYGAWRRATRPHDRLGADAPTPCSRRVSAISAPLGPSTVTPLTVRTTTWRAQSRMGMAVSGPSSDNRRSSGPISLRVVNSQGPQELGLAPA